MKFYNIDFHISVIADIKKIFTDLGHEVTDRCLSGHNWVMDRNRDSIPELDGDNWCGMMFENRWDEYYENHKAELDQYDAFICTYPPIFARLYEKTGKPIIIDMPIRYDYGVHKYVDRLIDWNTHISKGVASGRYILIANNKYDQKYCEIMSGLKPKHIPSLCEYFPKRPMDEGSNFLLYEQGNTLSNIDARIVDKKNALPHGYKWPAIHRFKAVVHLPYQISTMSVFEQYTANIPMIFPTPGHLSDMFLQSRYDVLSQVSTFQYFTPKQIGSIIPIRGTLDPNDYSSKDVVDNLWLPHADFYDKEWMQHITYFDSMDELKRICSEVNFLDISKKMQVENVDRKIKVYESWKEVLDGISS
jgi:hypothetical protein